MASTTLALLCLFSFIVLICGNNVPCNTLSASYEITACSPALPAVSGYSLFSANSSFTCKGNLYFNFSEVYPGAGFANLGFAYVSDVADQFEYYGYGWKLSGNYFSPENNEGTVNSSILPFYANFSVASNSIGTYSLYSSITIMKFDSPPNIYCNLPLSPSPSSIFSQKIIVSNSQESADILPPYVYEITTSSREYKIGDTISTLSYFTDKSNIMENSWTIYRHNTSKIECYDAYWKQITEREREIMGLPLIPSSSSKNLQNIKNTKETQTNGWYITECVIPDTAVKGQYNLSLLNIFDEFGNGVDNSDFWNKYVWFNLV